ncbi:hypothetical protein GCM10010129_42470 [Streptomyces fumigatiscleroticus]|nr:hypothetical protein GCM10010129_42470 [Streptomyces fumigatiscleroticus]
MPQPRPLGLAHAVLVARGFLGDDDFPLRLGDDYLQQGVTGFVRRAAAGPAAVRLLLTPVADPSALGDTEGGRVRRSRAAGPLGW